MTVKKTHTIGNIHLRGDPVEIESVEVSGQMLELIRRRTEWIIRACISFNWSTRDALANAYLAGMSDCIDTFESRGRSFQKSLPPRALEC